MSTSPLPNAHFFFREISSGVLLNLNGTTRISSIFLTKVLASKENNQRKQSIRYKESTESKCFTKPTILSSGRLSQPAAEQHKMRSQLAAQFMPAHSAYFNISRQKLPYFNVLPQNRVVCNCFATKQC